MCGIVGYVGKRQAAPVLLEGLRRLEYRGYDSAGIAVCKGNEIRVVKTEGRVDRLCAMTGDGSSVVGKCGIGHTRWATHGKPDACNAHPHASPGNRVVAVHNGIIENHAELVTELAAEGYGLKSQTDTEAAVLLLDWLYSELARRDMPLQERAVCAIAEMEKHLRGSYAMGILFGDQPNVVYAVVRNSPLAVGAVEEDGQGYMIASDITAMLGKVGRAIYLSDGEIACLTEGGAGFFDEQGNRIEKKPMPVTWTEKAADKGSYAHFMIKEIEEQPWAVRNTFAWRIKTDGKRKWVDLTGDGLEAGAFKDVKRVCLIGCGSAYHAACVGRKVIEQMARIPCEAEVASELRYREPMFQTDVLALIISQSGETADSLAALRMLKARGIRTLAVVNVADSSIAREADAVLLTCAGPEISVATTKAYAAQLAALYLLAIYMAQEKRIMPESRQTDLVNALLMLPEQIESAIALSQCIAQLAKQMVDCRDAFFIGRGMDHAVSMEGSLKLKEISYIHAEAYAAGELKHGTLSLIEPGVPVICMATQPYLLDKTLANASEARIRGAQVILVLQEDMKGQDADYVIFVPKTEPMFAASVAVIPLQLLAYYVGCAKGLDVDKPRNLAKSVTVE